MGDVFVANADGSRGAWLGDSQTGSDGSLERLLKEGCYVLVLVAPFGQSFERIADRPLGGDSRYAEQSFCHAGGERIEISAVLASVAESAVVGVVFNESGDPVSGVVVDIFVGLDAGQRGDWLGSTTTDDAGTYRSSVGAGCYVVVLIAPADATFVSSGTRYLEVPGCVEAGTELRVDGIVAGTTPESATIGGTVIDSEAQGVEGVVVDYFEAGADGGRGAWLGDVRTDGAGSYSRQVEAGCYTLVLVAPRGLTFVPNGGLYLELSVCVGAGEIAQLPTAQVSGVCSAPGPVNVDANPFGFVAAFSIVTGSDGKIYFVGDDDTPVTDIWVYDPVTGEGGNLGVPATMGSLIAGEGALYFKDLDGVSPPEIRSYDLATGEVTTIAELPSRFFTGPVLVGDQLLWQRNDVVMVYDTITGEISERPEGSFRLQGGIAEGPDGRVYYSRTLEPGSNASVIGSIDLETGDTAILDLAEGVSYAPNQLMFGPQGRLYFSGRFPPENGQPGPIARLVSVDPSTQATQIFFGYEQPREIVGADDGRVYFRSTRNGNEFLHGIDLNGGVLGVPISIEPNVVPFGTGPDGRLYFAAVDNPDADTRLRARLIRAPLDTETVIFDGVTFVDELHFSPDGNIYLRGFDGNETDLFAYQPLCDPAAG